MPGVVGGHASGHGDAGTEDHGRSGRLDRREQRRDPHVEVVEEVAGGEVERVGVAEGTGVEVQDVDVPQARREASTAPVRQASSVMSTGADVAVTPAVRRSLSRRSRVSAERATSPTSYPSRPNRWATEAPTPGPAPTTTITLVSMAPTLREPDRVDSPLFQPSPPKTDILLAVETRTPPPGRAESFRSRLGSH